MMMKILMLIIIIMTGLKKMTEHMQPDAVDIGFVENQTKGEKMSKVSKKEFVSNVTGEVWHKENIKNWKKWYERIGIVTEDIKSKGKNGEYVTLLKGSRVLIDDVRGRIKPQYRVTDAGDKIWFVPVEKIEIEKNEENV